MKASLGQRLAKAGLAVFGLALAVALVAIPVWGAGYYRLDMADREAHPLHAVLASGAGGGALLGIVGTSLMVAMLGYSVRKRFASVRWLGPQSLWLVFHLICGVTGPLFIVLHGGLHLPEGLVAVAFWCMVLVAASGVFGRYVYGFLPRLEGGRAMAWSDGMARLANLRAELVAATAGSHSHAIGEAVAQVRDLDRRADDIPGLLRLDREVRARRASIHALLASADLEPAARVRVAGALDEQLQLKRSLEASRVAYRMFRYWHLFHRPLASAMYVIVTLHVLTAVFFGDSLRHVAALFGG